MPHRRCSVIHVRRHKRQLESGKTVTVRAHERDVDPDPRREVPEWSRPAQAAEYRNPAFDAAPGEDWWADDGDYEESGGTYRPPDTAAQEAAEREAYAAGVRAHAAALGGTGRPAGG
jgi:hypothetical protein